MIHEGDDGGLIGLGLCDHAVVIDALALQLGVLGGQGAIMEGDGDRGKAEPACQNRRTCEGADLDTGRNGKIADLAIRAMIDLPVRKPALRRAPNGFFYLRNHPQRRSETARPKPRGEHVTQKLTQIQYMPMQVPDRFRPRASNSGWEIPRRRGPEC